MKKVALVILAAGVALGLPVFGAGTNYVWLSAPASAPPYDTWETAATNIQTAVNYASTNLTTYDTVLVTNGNYAVMNTISVTNGVKVIGFGGAANTVVYRNDPAEFSVFTMTHSNAVVDGVTVSNGVALKGGGVNMTAGTLRNCTLRRNGSSGDNSAGAGIWMSGGLVTNCLVTGGYRAGGANASGGGIAMTGGLVVNSVVSNNVLDALTAINGRGQAGGIYLAGGTVENCVIVSNAVSSFYLNDWDVFHYGGGGVLVLSGGVLDRCIVAGNRSDHRGGGVSVRGGIMKNCLIYTNTTTSATLGNGGGGVYMTGGAAVNCTVAANVASATEGGGVSMSGGGVTNTIVYFNSGTVVDTRNAYKTGGSMDFSCVTPTVSGQGNIMADPQFVNTNAADYRLARYSPCADSGIILSWMTGAVDLDGNRRIIGGIVDMGAYESIRTPQGTIFIFQ